MSERERAGRTRTTTASDLADPADLVAPNRRSPATGRDWQGLVGALDGLRDDAPTPYNCLGTHLGPVGPGETSSLALLDRPASPCAHNTASLTGPRRTLAGQATVTAAPFDRTAADLRVAQSAEAPGQAGQHSRARKAAPLPFRLGRA